MYYLHLKFESASLVFDDSFLGKYEDVLNAPIGQSQVCNMLHVMLGYQPKPKNKRYKEQVDVEWDERIKDIAFNHSYVRYYPTNTFTAKDGKRKFVPTFFQSNKPYFNSHLKVSCDIDGEKIGGRFTWTNFTYQFFKSPTAVKDAPRVFNRDLYKETLTLFNSVLGCSDVTREYDFVSFLYAFWEHKDDEEVIAFKDRLGESLWGKKSCPLGSRSWKEIIFDKDMPSCKSTGNSAFNTEYPLFNQNGVKYKVSYDGEIIFEIEDDSIVDMIRTHSKLPTILDGGLVTVLGFGKTPPSFDFKDEYDRISV